VPVEIWAALLIVGLGAILTYCIWLTRSIHLLELKLVEMSVQIAPFWASVQAKISADLHHPDPRYHEMDRLLEKLDELTITDAERVRLKELLLKRSTDMHDDMSEPQRQAASAMIGVMDLVLHEAQAIADATPATPVKDGGQGPEVLSPKAPAL
jgi:hypothetical protein